MSERKACVRCGRSIDAYARICPYCTWSQDQPVPATAPAQAATPPPPRRFAFDRRLTKVIAGAGGVVIAVAAFAIGSHMHSGHQAPVTSTVSAPAAQAAPESRTPRADVTLVPDNGAIPGVAEPITSVPVSDSAQGLASQVERTDATAASSAEYAAIAQRAAAEKARNNNAPALVDPRSITGNAYPAERPVPRPAPAARPATAPAAVAAARAVNHTPPVPESQPLPDVSVSGNQTVRLELTVGPDGRVTDINVLEAMPGDMGKVVGAVQRWRFRPATLNGQPVPSTFITALSFHGRE